MKYTLGLDIGTNSLGWAMVSDEPSTGNQNLISGVRVFPEGVERNTTGNEQSRSMERRGKRLMRRQHERKVRRKRKMLSILLRNGLLPVELESLKDLLSLSPYCLRKKGLDEELSLFEFGRVLYNLCQRRGFKSNRRNATKEESDLGKTITELQNHLDEHGFRTIGEYFATIDEPDKIRKIHTSRDQFIHEFTLLWEKQSSFHPEILTDQIREKVFDAIFYQRPLKPMTEKIGDCELEPNEKRCPKASWYAQEFRLLKEINDLRIRDMKGNEMTLSTVQRQTLHESLHTKLKKEKELPLENIRKILDLTEDQTLSIQAGKKASMLGNMAEFGLRKIFGKRFETERSLIIDDLLESAIAMDPDQFAGLAKERWNLSEEEINGLFRLLDLMPSNYMNYSRAAIMKLLPFLRESMGEYEAREKCGYNIKSDSQTVLDFLPSPLEVLPNMTNPIVRKALFEVRRVVNAIIREYGKPEKIVVELARDTKGSLEERNKQLSENKKREAKREEIRRHLIEKGVPNPSRTDILKFQLWEECGKKCPYTGRSIGFHQIFGVAPEVQIEHILPYSRSLDDSQANKTLCFINENQRKGDHTPFEFYGGNPATWEDLLVRIQSLPYQKRKKFTQKEIDLDKCIERQLNDTRYINRQVRSYLALLGAPVNATRGQVTAELRWRWGLNTILKPDKDEKNRSDHRHHAIDAVVIGLTNAKHLKNLSRKSDFKKKNLSFPPPWDDFRSETEHVIKDMLVSHRPTRKIAGKLHEETFYGPTPKQGTYVYRKELQALTPAMIEKIRDPRIKELVRDRVNQSGGDPKKAFHKDAEPLYLPNRNGPPIQIKKVRLEATGAMVPFEDAEGKPFRFAPTGSNHHVSIFEYVEKGKTKRVALARTMLEAASIAAENGRRRRAGLPDISIILREHPTRRDAEFVMSLCRNDLVLLWSEKYHSSQDKAEMELCRVQTLSVNPVLDLSFQPHHAARIDEKGTERRINTLDPEKTIIKKIQVDPLGRVMISND